MKLRQEIIEYLKKHGYTAVNDDVYQPTCPTKTIKLTVKQANHGGDYITCERVETITFPDELSGLQGHCKIHNI